MKRIPERITAKWLRLIGACEAEVQRFEAVFPALLREHQAVPK